MMLKAKTISAPAGPPRLAGQNRIRLLGLCFAFAFLAIAGQLLRIDVTRPVEDVNAELAKHQDRIPRPDIVDRNGNVLATDIAVASLYADPRKIPDVDEAVELLTAALPDVDAAELRRKLLKPKSAFAWIKRARTSYAERSGQVDALRASKVAKALGLETQQADLGQALMAFVNAGREQQAQLRQVLQEYDPQLLNEVRGLVWKEAIRTAERQSGGMTKAAFDPLRAADNLMQLVGTKGDEFEGLFSKAEAEQVRKAIGNIRAIDVRLRGTAQAAEPEKVSMTAANWGTAASRPFLLQQVWRFVTRNKVERMLFTAEGRAQLQAAVDTTDWPKFSQTLARTGAMLYGDFATLDQQE